MRELTFKEGVMIFFIALISLLVTFAIVDNSYTKESVARENVREAIEQLEAVLVIDELMRGEEVTLSELTGTGIVRIDFSAMDQAVTAWLKIQGIDSGGIGGVVALPSPVSQQLYAFLNCPIKLPAFQLPVKAEDEKK